MGPAILQWVTAHHITISTVRKSVLWTTRGFSIYHRKILWDFTYPVKWNAALYKRKVLPSMWMSSSSSSSNHSQLWLHYSQFGGNSWCITCILYGNISNFFPILDRFSMMFPFVEQVFHSDLRGLAVGLPLSGANWSSVTTLKKWMCFTSLKFSDPPKHFHKLLYHRVHWCLRISKLLQKSLWMISSYSVLMQCSSMNI
jgi:hypothetical protein